MSVAEVKNELTMQILQTEDQLLLKHLAQYFQNLLTNKNWWADLPDLQKELLEEELEDVRLYDESKNRREERIPLEDYLAQRKADAHA